MLEMKELKNRKNDRQTKIDEDVRIVELNLKDLASMPDKNYLATRRRARSLDEINLMPKRTINFLGEQIWKEDDEENNYLDRSSNKCMIHF